MLNSSIWRISNSLYTAGGDETLQSLHHISDTWLHLIQDQFPWWQWMEFFYILLFQSIQIALAAYTVGKSQ